EPLRVAQAHAHRRARAHGVDARPQAARPVVGELRARRLLARPRELVALADVHRVDDALLEAAALVDRARLHARAARQADGPRALPRAGARVGEGLHDLGDGEVAAHGDVHFVRADRERRAGPAALVEAAAGEDAELRSLRVARAAGIGEAARPVVPEVGGPDVGLARAGEDHALALREAVAAALALVGELARSAVDAGLPVSEL